ncbi:pyridoxal phosphate-dependent aminotransferase [Magnetococcales bacterium HHB-1]
MITKALTQNEHQLAHRIHTLHQQAGTHPTNILHLLERIPEINLKIDACFLSNPYATDLVMDYLKRDLLQQPHRFRALLERYPSQNHILGSILSKILDLPAEMLFAGNGAAEIIHAVLHNFAQQRAMIILPTFSAFYEFLPLHVQALFHTLDKQDHFNLDLTRLLKDIQQRKPDTLVLINPNNPNGGYCDRQNIESLLDALQSLPLIIIDESFIHFSYEHQQFDVYHSAINLVEKYKNLIIIKSLSKDFGVAGLRAGFAVMHPKRVQQLVERGYLWNVSGLAEWFLRLLAQEEFQQRYEPIRQHYIQHTGHFFKQLGNLEPIFKTYPSKANFILLEILNGMSAWDLTALLLIRHGIYVRNCDDKKGLESGEFVRIAARTKEENQQVLYALNGLYSKR